MRLTLLLCAGSTWFMTGLIWFVQVVHYPLFAEVDAGRFATYHRAHARRTTWVVVGPMVLELATAALLAWRPPHGGGRLLPWIGLAAALFCWASTGMVQVPLHDRLSRGLDLDVVRRLVRTNAARALAWTVHAVVVAAMVGRAIPA